MWDYELGRGIHAPFAVAHLLASLCIDVIEKYTGGCRAIHRGEMISLHPPQGEMIPTHESMRPM